MIECEILLKNWIDFRVKQKDFALCAHINQYFFPKPLPPKKNSGDAPEKVVKWFHKGVCNSLYEDNDQNIMVTCFVKVLGQIFLKVKPIQISIEII